MFCERCGARLPDDARFCSSCGKVLAQESTPPLDGRVNRHLRLLVILWLAVGAVRLFAAAVIYLVGRVIFVRLAIPFLPEQFLGGILTVAASVVLLKAILAFIAGWGLLEREPWARVFTLVLGFLALLIPPLGTALGIYTLWVLLPQQSEREYRMLTQTA